MSTLLYQSHVFGLQGSIPHALHHIDDQHVVYPAGSSVILYNIEQKNQRFISLAEGGLITAMTATTRLIAVAEQGDKKTAVSVYDARTLKRKRVLRDDEWHSKDIVSIALSQDNHFLLSQLSEPDWLLQLWNWEKGKVFVSLKLNYANNVRVLQVSINPFERNVPHLCASGHNIFRVYRFAEGTLKPLTFQKTDHRANSSHVWLSTDRIAVSTEDGKVLVYENAELKMEISTGLLQDVALKPHFLTCFRATQAGFVAGSNNGVVQVWERTEDGMMYRPAKEIKVENSQIRGITLAANDDSAICSLDNNQLITITSLQSDDVRVEKLSQAHSGAISGLDECIRKPLIATCGSDHSIRIWNFLENTMEICKFFKSEPFSIAFHPSGLYLLVGFAEGVKLLKILLDDIRPYWEYNARGCRECRFSNGGQYFALAIENVVTIRSTWSFDLVVTLKGHAGKIRSVAWSPDDTKVMSVSYDGSVIEWDLKLQRRMAEHIHQIPYHAAIFGIDKASYLGMADGRITELREGQIVRELSVNAPITQMCVGRSGRMLVIATATGHVKAMRYPPVGPDLVSLHTHTAPVIRLRMSYDEQYVFTCSADGCLGILRVADKDLRGNKRDRGEAVYSDEILALRADVMDQLKVTMDLRQKVEDIRLENERILEQRETMYTQKLAETSDRFLKDIDGLVTENEQLRLTYETNITEHSKALTTLKSKHVAEREEMDASTRFKLKAEEERFRNLENSLEDKKSQWSKKMLLVRDSLDQEMEDLRRYYSEKLEERQREHETLQGDLGRKKKDFEQQSKDVEGSTDQEILQLQYVYEQRLREERSGLKLIQKENEEMHQKYESLLKRIDGNKAEIQKMVVEERKLTAVIKTLEKDIADARRELQEREDTIEDKDKRISDLKKKNKELEKFKFVLDYKIVELRKQIEPREQDITHLQSQLREMGVELNSYVQERSAMGFVKNDIRQKLQATIRELQYHHQRRADAEFSLQAVQKDVSKMMECAEDKNELKNIVRVMFQKYCSAPEEIGDDAVYSRPLLPSLTGPSSAGSSEGSKSPVKSPRRDGNTRKKMISEPEQTLRQRDLLEKTSSTVHRKLLKQKVAREQETRKLLRENEHLTGEVNSLRKEILAGSKDDDVI